MSPTDTISPGAGKCNKIRHIIQLRQMLRRWRTKASASSSMHRITTGAHVPSDVPAGHVAVCVGSRCTRFVVRATYLNHPIFRNLLVQAEEEYGFSVDGPLTIPCEESVFEDILRSVSSNSGRFNINLDELKRCCHVDLRSKRDVLAEARPLLRG
ncbi:hypothetical protein LIER_27569 [Lithospermum erythrorhizon]|uniref:Uncharacterized protein n=1 Tax=Lithospermum erythrorhizon TaxID=34254 RepID=A0AAV3RCU1_LITER